MSYSISARETARLALRISAARVSAGAVSVFVVLVLLLHFIEPQFGPTWRFVSEYSSGDYGWIMKLGFFTLAFGCAAAVAAIRPHATTRVAKVGLFFLVLTVVGLVLAGIYDQDPITSNVKTGEGKLHAIATMLGIPGFTVASLLIGLSLARRWKSARTPLIVLSQLPWITFVSMPLYMAIAMSAAGGFGPTVWVGLINRLFLLAMCAWLVFVAWHIERVAHAPL